MHLVLRSEVRGRHIETRVFMGEARHNVGLCGTLTMDIGEWQIFGAALLLAADNMGQHLQVHFPDDQRVLAQLAEIQE